MPCSEWGTCLLNVVVILQYVWVVYYSEYAIIFVCITFKDCLLHIPKCAVGYTSYSERNMVPIMQFVDLDQLFSV